MSTSQQALVVDQFTRQAVAFAFAKQIQDQDALNLLLSASGAAPSDRTLDVALVLASLFAISPPWPGMDVARRKTSAKMAQRGRVDGIVGALLCFALGLTLLLTGFNDRASGESVVRVRDKPDHVAKARGPTAGEFKQRVVLQMAGGIAMLIAGAGVLYFSYRSPLGRQPSPDDDS